MLLFVYAIGCFLLALGLSSYWRPTTGAVLWWPRAASIGAWVQFLCVLYVIYARATGAHTAPF